MLTKTVRSRFNHEVGEKVEGCTIIEKRVVAEPVPSEQRRGIYDYVVEAPPAPAKEARKKNSRQHVPAPASQEGFTRAAPEEVGAVIRRLPSR